MQTRIFPIQDVENLILEKLNFWDRRRLAQVSRRYREEMAEDLVIPFSYYQSESGRLHHFFLQDEAEGIQWILKRDPTIRWTYTPRDICVNGCIKILQWQMSLDSSLTLNVNLLSKAVRFNQATLRDWILTQITVPLEEMPKLVKEIRYWTVETADWVMAFFQAHGYTGNWLTSMELWKLDFYNRPLLLWLSAHGVDFSNCLGDFLVLGDLEPLEWAERELHLDIRPIYDQIFSDGIEYCDVTRLEWLLARGFVPPPSPAFRPHEQQALELIYFGHDRNPFPE